LFFCSEALTNVVKHARASSAWVRVACADNRCTIEVCDDGIGGAQPRQDTSGLGLHDRIGALGGALQVSSMASADTTLRAWIITCCRTDRMSPEATLVALAGLAVTGFV